MGKELGDALGEFSQGVSGGAAEQIKQLMQQKLRERAQANQFKLQSDFQRGMASDSEKFAEARSVRELASREKFETARSVRELASEERRDTARSVRELASEERRDTARQSRDLDFKRKLFDLTESAAKTRFERELGGKKEIIKATEEFAGKRLDKRFENQLKVLEKTHGYASDRDEIAAKRQAARDLLASGEFEASLALKEKLAVIASSDRREVNANSLANARSLAASAADLTRELVGRKDASDIRREQAAIEVEKRGREERVGRERRGLIEAGQRESRDVERRKIELDAARNERDAQREAKKAELDTRVAASRLAEEERRTDALSDKLFGLLERADIRDEQKAESQRTIEQTLAARIGFKRVELNDPKALEEARLLGIDVDAMREYNDLLLSAVADSVKRPSPASADRERRMSLVLHDAQVEYQDVLRRTGSQVDANRAMGQIFRSAMSDIPAAIRKKRSLLDRSRKEAEEEKRSEREAAIRVREEHAAEKRSEEAKGKARTFLRKKLLGGLNPIERLF